MGKNSLRTSVHKVFEVIKMIHISNQITLKKVSEKRGGMGPTKLDPSRTGFIRKRFELDVTRRFIAIRKAIRKLIVDEDAFGLKRKNALKELDPWANNTKELSNQVENTRWRFRSTSQKVEEFQRWLATQIELTEVASQAEDVYYKAYIDQAYKKGVARSFDEYNKAAIKNKGQEKNFYEGTRQEFLNSSFNHPASIEKVKQLAGRTFTDLRNVTTTMSTQMSRSLLDGFVKGDNPLTIARQLNKDVEGIGINRARTIARTEVIRAHAEGQLDSLERQGAEKVGVMVEWSTAGDDRVCSLCADLEGVVLDIKEARGIIPRHPNCVTGDMCIEADSRFVMSAKYTGKIFEFITSFGTKLSVTSNHIMLTQRGWVFAKDITDIDYLVQSPDSQFNSITPNNNQTHSTIRDIFHSLIKVADPDWITETLPMSEHFHGDGVSINSKIKIISTQGILRSNGQSNLIEQLKKYLFYVGSIPVSDSSGLNRQSTFSSFLERTATTSDSLVCCSGISEILLARSLGHHKLIGNHLISRCDTSTQKIATDALSSNSKSNCQSMNTVTLEVELHNLIGQFLIPIQRIDSRHVSNLSVYDVETQSSLYSINGILTSNCRCAFRPANIGESTALQTRSKSSIDRAFDKSIKREIPKRTKRSLAQQKKISPWSGARTKIAVKRPKSIFDRLGDGLGSKIKPKKYN